MLTALGYDPATQTQRLGDGFYEQRLVREQVAQLTGRRFLGSFTDDEAQYRALLDAGQAFASAYQLKPGIALTREQMALLTSDIVWLVERSVTLPDGRTQRVLVPQLYALVDPDTPTLSQGLISAKGAKIDLTDGLFNAGTLAARENLSINAASITNILGQLQGNNVDLRASGSITSILGQIAARQNLSMNAGENMVFMGGGIRAGGNASLSAGGDLLLLAYDTGKQVRVIPRDKDNNPNNDKGPTWAYENSTYNQTGVDINVGGSFSGSAGGNLVAQGVTANVGGSTNLSAGKDMQLTTALHGHVQTLDFFNRYKTAGSLIKIEQNIHQSNADLTNSANSWSSGGGLNLSAGGSIDIVGAQINSQGYSYSTGGNYSERAAYDIHERVSTSSTKMSGPGTYLLDFTNNMNWLATGGQAGGRTETYRGTNDVDSTRTAIVTNINAGSGEVKHNVAGETFIEGSIVKGGLISPERVGPRVTLAAAVDTRHVEHSVSTSTIRWQSTDSTGYIQQTLHMPEIHGTIPAGMSAYQGAGGVSVQLPAGSNVRSAIEQLSKEPGKEYLKELGSRSDIDWQRVEVLNKSLDFSKSGLTQEAAIAVAIIVTIASYGTASEWGAAIASSYGAAAGAAVTAGTTALASTAAVSLINNKGDIGATLKELGNKENLKGLLLTMATAGLTQGILGNIKVDGGTTLANVNAQSSIELLFAKQALQGLTSAVLESAVMGTNLEDAIKNNLQSALINTVAAKGAFTIGEAGKTGDLNAASKAIAHALLGCAVGAANAGNSSGCAPGAAGGAIGEIVASLYGNGQNLGGLEEQLKSDPNNAQLKAQVDQIRNTVTELAKLSGAGAALLIGGDASSAQIAMGTASNAAVNNYLNHTEATLLAQLQRDRTTGRCDTSCESEIKRLETLDDQRNQQLAACEGQTSPQCTKAVSDVRVAAAGYIRAASNNLTSSLEYASEQSETLKLAQNTMGDYTAWNVAKGVVDNTVDGLVSLAGAAYTGFKAVTGDAQAGAQAKEGLGAAWNFVSNPDNWPQLLGVMSSVEREQLAQAYETGNGKAVATTLGAAITNLPITGGAGTIKKVVTLADKAEEAARLGRLPDLSMGSGKVELPPSSAVASGANGGDVINAQARLSVSKVTAPIDFDGHIFSAEVKPNGTVVGGHSTANGTIKVIPGTASAPNAQGVYSARIEVADPNNPGQFLQKTNNGGISTLFPDSWTADRIKVEVDAAFQNRTVIGNKWTGTTPSGVKVEGFLKPKTTVYPKL